MPAYAYSEDVELDVEFVTDGEIRACKDLAQLEAWDIDAEALIDDVQGQLDGHRIAGQAHLPWIYRACQKIGFVQRSRTRIRRQMKALGHDPNPYGTVIERLNRKLYELRAEQAVAVEFKRLAIEQLPPAEFARLESAAVHNIAQRARKDREGEAVAA